MARRRDERGDHDMVDVVLVQVGSSADGPDGPDDPDGPDGPDGPDDENLAAAPRTIGALVARHRRTAVGLLGLSALVAVVLAVVDMHQAGLRRERWAPLATVMLPMETGPVELWRVDLTTTTVVAFGHGLYLEQERSGDVHAFDADTRAIVWTVPAASADAPTTPHRCVAVDSEPPSFVCRSSGADGSAALVVLDATDGSELARRSVAVPPSILVAVGPDVVVGAPARDGGLDLRREDAVTGDTRWTRHTLSSAAAPADADDLVLSWGLRWRVADGALFISDPAVALDLATGDTLLWASGAGQVTTNVEALVDGGWATGPGIPTGEAGSAFNADGSVRFVFEGSPLDLVVDDGSRPDLLLVRSWPLIKALDPVTGDVRWTSRDLCGDGNPVVRLEGSLLCTRETGGEGAVGRIDLTTGKEVWRRSVGRVDGMSVATDGDRVVVLGGGPGRRAVTSYAWADGESRWESSVSHDVDALWVADRRLYGIGGAVLVRLG